MDKQVEAAQADSISAVRVKVGEYEPSVYSEAPPAYKKHRASAVEITRIVSFTLIACSFILGCFILASSYVESQANMCVQQEFSAVQASSEPLSRESPSFQALQVDPLLSDESKQAQAPIQIKMPVQIDFDDLAAALIEKNEKARMNCVIEKRKSEEVTDHQAKNVALPFGVNMTSDPRYEHVTGERMVIFCESGNEDKPEQPARPQAQAPFMPPMVPSQQQLHPLMFEQPERKPFIQPQPIVLQNIDRRQPPFAPAFDERRFPQPNPFLVSQAQNNPFFVEERRIPQSFVVPEERKFPGPHEAIVLDARKFVQPQPNPFNFEARRFPQPESFVSEESRFPRPQASFMVEERRPQPNPFAQEDRFPQPSAFMPEARRFSSEERRMPQPNGFAPQERFVPQERKFQQPLQNAIILEDRKPNYMVEERRFRQPINFLPEERRFPQPQASFMVEDRSVPQPQPNMFSIEERKPQQPNPFVVDERRPFPQQNRIMIEEHKPQFDGQIIFGDRPNPNQIPQATQTKSIFIEEPRKPNFEPSQAIPFEASDRKMPPMGQQAVILDARERKQGPITIIAREEHIIPVYQREADAPPPAMNNQPRRLHLEPVPLESTQEKLFKPHQPNLIEGRAFTNTIDNLNMIIAEVAASTNQQRHGPQERFPERPQRFPERPQRFPERPQEGFQPQEEQRPQEPADTVRPPPPPFQRLPIHIPINMMGGFQVPSQESQQDSQQQDMPQNQETNQQTELPQQQQEQQVTEEQIIRVSEMPQEENQQNGNEQEGRMTSEQQSQQEVHDQTAAQEQLQEASTEQGDTQESGQDESVRPHFVQPRSIRE